MILFAKHGNNSSFSFLSHRLKSTFKVSLGNSSPPLLPPRSLDTKCTSIPFAELIASRRLEAKRSLVVQVKSIDSKNKIKDFCAKNFGPVSSLHFYQNDADKHFNNFYVVEFSQESSVKKAFTQICHYHHQSEASRNSVPVQSPFSWFFSLESNTQSSQSNSPITYSIKEKRLLSEYNDKGSLSEQLITYYKYNQMSELSQRLRFLACEQLESAMSGIFGHHLQVLPFGSSVNSFGTNSSDLDMVFHFDVSKSIQKQSDQLYFHVKGGFNVREMSQIYIRIMTGVVDNLLPGCRNAQNIGHARVPILKYQQHLLGLDVDLSVNSLSGYYMSELLYIMGELDPRVRPLIFFIREWAKITQLITDSRPTKLFTNFTLTLLVIFYLQSEVKILPSIDELRKFSTEEEISLDGSKRDFIRNISGYQFHFNGFYDKEEPSLESLLIGFFAYYRGFSFDSKALCLNTGSPSNKLRKEPMVILNPLDSELNVSLNLYPKSVNHFQICCAKYEDLMLDSSQSLESLLTYELGTRKIKIRDVWSLSNLRERAFKKSTIKENIIV